MLLTPQMPSFRTGLKFCSLVELNNLQIYKPSALLAYENISGKGEKTGNLHFLLFPQCLQEFFAFW